VSDFLARVKVVATTFVTYAVLVSSVVSGVVATLQANSDIDGTAGVASWGVTVLAWLGSAIVIARNVAQVAPGERGLLPQAPQNAEQQRFWNGSPR